MIPLVFVHVGFLPVDNVSDFVTTSKPLGHRHWIPRNVHSSNLAATATKIQWIRYRWRFGRPVFSCNRRINTTTVYYMTLAWRGGTRGGALNQ